MQAKRANWNDTISGVGLDHLVFLDESGVNINLTRHYGWAKKDQRVIDNIPLTMPKNTTILSSIRANGEMEYTVYEGGTTKEKFKSYLENILRPTLSRGDVVIMDNMRSHHARIVTVYLDGENVRYDYLPAYSPDLNPIEKLWSKIKSYLRKVKVRDSKKLLSVIRNAFSTVTKTDCENWFASCGYVR